MRLSDWTKSLLLALTLVLGTPALAEDTATPEAIEEIVVSAPKTLSGMRAAMHHAQDETFALFNELIDDPEFEISCRMERPFKDGFDPIPVHREVRVCETAFFRRESARANQDFVDGFDEGQVAGAEQHAAELDAKIKYLITTDPSFRAAMSKYVLAKRDYDAAKEADMSTGLFSRLFGSKE